MQQLTKQTVFKRVEPCRCGCKGKDSRHRQTYSRTVYTVDGITGMVKFPGNPERTEVQRYRLSDGSFTTCWFAANM